MPSEKVARLSDATIKLVPGSVSIPAYARSEHGCGIVHMGIGAFHRAHQAVYTDAALAVSGGDWRIVGVSMRSPVVRDQLVPQDGLYTVVSREAKTEQLRIIGSVARVICAPEEPAAVVSTIADSNTRIVSLTITEKGYCLDPASGQLNKSHQDIRADIENPGTPRTAIGFIVAGLHLRWSQGGEGMTVLSCDNLPDNGSLARTVILELANIIEPELGQWIEREVSFPSTMVDRIVPATTGEDRQLVSNVLGLSDHGAVVTETFSQWVIEDKFSSGRPAWEDGGALFVQDVAPFEKMKLRLLNGSHSCLAYLGYVAGFHYVHEVIKNKEIRKLIRLMMDREVTPTLAPPVDFDLDDYKDQLIGRFDNPALQHQTWQIAMDGSQKLPQRLLDPIRERVNCGESFNILCLAVAAWMRYVIGPDEAGNEIEVSDPLEDRLSGIRARWIGQPTELCREFLVITEIFGRDLPKNKEFVAAVTTSLQSLFTHGVVETVENTLAESND